MLLGGQQHHLGGAGLQKTGADSLNVRRGNGIVIPGAAIKAGQGQIQQYGRVGIALGDVGVALH